MKKYYYNIFSLILIFIFIFGPVLNKYGSWFDLIFIFSIAVFLFNINKIKQLNKKPYIYFHLLFIFYFFISIRILFYPDLTFIDWAINFIKPFRIVLTLFSGYFLIKFLHKKNFTFLNLLYLIYFAIVLHSLIVILQFFYIEFRDFIYNYTTTGDFRSSFEYDFRMGGFSGTSGGAVLSTVQSLGIVLVPFLLKLNFDNFSRFLIYVSSIIILLSIILIGRSGIYSIIIFLPISIYLVYGLVKTIKYSIFTFLIAIFAFLFINELLISLDLTTFYNSFYRTFDSFISLNESGSYENETVEILKDYILIPDIETLLFGNNDALLNYEFDRNLDSDIGYVRNVFSFGIFGFIIFILPFFLLLIFTIKNMKNSLPNRLLFLLLIVMAFFHSKEGFLYVRMFWSIICLIIAFISIDKRNIKVTKVCVE